MFVTSSFVKPNPEILLLSCNPPISFPYLPNKFLLIRRLQVTYGTAAVTRRITIIEKKRNNYWFLQFTEMYHLSRGIWVEYPQELELTDPNTNRENSGKIKLTCCTNVKNINLLSWKRSFKVVFLYVIRSEQILKSKPTFINPRIIRV